MGLALGSSLSCLLMPMRCLITFQPQATATVLHHGVPHVLVSKVAVSHPFLSLNVPSPREVWRDQRVCTPFVGGATGFAHPSWRTQGCCLQEKELFLWTCSTNQANPPCVVVRRLTGAHPWEGDEAKEEVSLLDLGRGSPCTLIYAITATCIAFFPSPFNRLLDTSLPGIWGHPTPSPAPITICSPQPCAAQPQFLVHCSSTALCAILSPWL